MINKTTNKMHVIDGLKTGKAVITDSIEIANEFGKYFATVGKNFATKIEKSKIEANTYIGKIERNIKSLYLYPTNSSEVLKLINELPNKTSSGHDDISNQLLKKIGPFIVKALVEIFNKSMQEGTVPSRMKHADVIPLYKSKEKDLTSNCQPISLLLTISKLLEKIMYKRTYGFLEKTGQIYNSQYGFRSKHSCGLAVSKLLSEVIKKQ